jgi:GT2 family glycosyltransferase
MSDLAIVTVTHNSETDLARLLDSIERHLGAAPPQVVVVDSGSSDGSAALAADRGAQVVALERNVGFGAGCNAGLALVDAEVTALVNPDVELLDSGLAALARRARAAEALLAPRLVHEDGSVQDSAHPPPGRADDLVAALLPRALLPPPLRRRYEPWRSHAVTRVGWAIAACLVARTSLLRSLGPFDERAFLFYEDMELCLEAARRGVPTFLHPDIVVRHLGGTSTGRALAADEDLALRAARRREVVARQGRLRLLMDDTAQAATFATRAAARTLARRGGDRERAQLRALRSARGAGGRR